MQKILFYLVKGLEKICLYTKNAINNRILKIIFYSYGVSHGKNICTNNGLIKLSLRKGFKMIIGNNVTFNNYHNTGWFAKSFIFVGKKGVLKIGNSTGLNGVMIACDDSITIGDYVNIGGGTRIYDTNFHNMGWKERRDVELNGVAKTAPVIIEDDVFIGTGCIIGKGITIGARSIIAAGSVVVKSIPADCIAGGNPCKIIKQFNN